MTKSYTTVELSLTDEGKRLIAEMQKQMEVSDAERAVIEAAEAWFPGPCSLEPSPPERELAAAVKALQKARQG